MDDPERYDWIAAHIFPFEREVRGWLRRHVRSLSTPDIDDLVQEAYARLWSANFAAIGNGRGYFYAVLRNLLSEQARRARIVPMERLGEIEALAIPGNEPDPDRSAGVRQEFERLQQVIAGLPARCREAFELQKFDGCSQREIARRMQISEKTVEKHLARALAHVLEAMQPASDDGNGPNAIRGSNDHDTARPVG